MQDFMKLAKDQMKSGKSIELVNSSLDKYYSNKYVSEWNATKRAEYDVSYPTVRVLTQDEKDVVYTEYVDGLADGEVAIQSTEYVYKGITIDNIYCELVPETTDVTGNVINEYLTPEGCIPTYEQFLNGETCPKYDTTLDITAFKDTDENYRAYKKITRDTAVDALQITTSAGFTFDANEVSQSRMGRAILALNALPTDTTIVWTMANNTRETVGIAELSEALILAGQAQGELW